MNIRIVLMVVYLLSAVHVIAQSVSPSVKDLDFAMVAEQFNTCNDKREPMTFLSGCSIAGDDELLRKNPIEIMFNPIAKVDREDCLLMRWDPVLRAWKKFPGNRLNNTFEGRNAYWSAVVDASGHYALMKEIANHGSTQLLIPGGYAAEEWKYVQPNLGIVCEGFSTTRSIAVPVMNLSPLAQISLKFRKNGEPVSALSGLYVGQVVKDVWKDPDAINGSYELSLTTSK